MNSRQSFAPGHGPTRLLVGNYPCAISEVKEHSGRVPNLARPNFAALNARCGDGFHNAESPTAPSYHLMSAGFVARRDARNRHTFGPRAGGVDHPNFAHNFVSIQQVSSLGLVAAILPLSRYTD